MKNNLNALTSHHGEPGEFVQLMKDHASRRFDQLFWDTWEEWMVPLLHHGSHIADFGAGPGVLVRLLQQRHPTTQITAVEFAPYMLHELKNLSCQVVTHDLQLVGLPVQDESFEIIIMSHCLHEMLQPITALQTAYRCLKPGGRCFIIDWVRVPFPQYLEYQKLPNVFDPQMNHECLSDIFTHFVEHNRYTEQDVAWMLENTNFKIVHNRFTEEKSLFYQWVVEK